MHIFFVGAGHIIQPATPCLVESSLAKLWKRPADKIYLWNLSI